MKRGVLASLTGSSVWSAWYDALDCRLMQLRDYQGVAVWRRRAQALADMRERDDVDAAQFTGFVELPY